MTPDKQNIYHSILFVALVALLLALLLGGLMIGTTAIPLDEVWNALTGTSNNAGYETIICRMRLPKIIVATLAGIALSASGLQMQTLFRNPLAGPYVLGINSGASLGVALFTLATPMLSIANTSWLTNIGLTGMAWIGSAAILFVVMSLSRRIKNVSVILIIGMMLGSAITALVGILQYMGTDESLKAFIVWTMGSLSTVTIDSLKMLVPVVLVGAIIALATVKPLNMLNIGENYARTMGLNVKLSRAMVFISTTLLAGTITAYCGPIGFIGLAMPHVARMTFRTANHRVLMPASMLWGAVAMLLCSLLSDLTARSGVMLPVNTITSLLGIPIIIFVVLRNRNRQ